MNLNSQQRIVLLGPPGGGKGTQAEMLATALGVPAISTGEMLRAAVAAGTPLGVRVKEIMDSGELVDDDTMADVVAERLAAHDVAGGYLLDGYPRTLGQAETLAGILDAGGRSLTAVLYLPVPDEVLVTRALARGRGADDREEVIRARLEIYREKTAPLIEYYRERGLLREVNGDQTIEEVQAAILDSLQVVAR